MSTRPEGITHPSIDELLGATESKYSLVIWAARRARQLTGYYSQMGDYLLEYVGPLVETNPQEKPMSIALREIHAGLLLEKSGEEEEEGEQAGAPSGTDTGEQPGEPELRAVDTGASPEAPEAPADTD